MKRLLGEKIISLIVVCDLAVGGLSRSHLGEWIEVSRPQLITTQPPGGAGSQYHHRPGLRILDRLLASRRTTRGGSHHFTREISSSRKRRRVSAGRRHCIPALVGRPWAGGMIRSGGSRRRRSSRSCQSWPRFDARSSCVVSDRGRCDGRYRRRITGAVSSSFPSEGRDGARTGMMAFPLEEGSFDEAVPQWRHKAVIIPG